MSHQMRSRSINFKTSFRCLPSEILQSNLDHRIISRGRKEEASEDCSTPLWNVKRMLDEIGRAGELPED
jgi:hypothetical protein